MTQPKLWRKLISKPKYGGDPTKVGAAVHQRLIAALDRKGGAQSDTEQPESNQYDMAGDADELESKELSLVTTAGYGIERERILTFFGKMLKVQPSKVEPIRLSVMSDGRHNDSTDQNVLRVRLPAHCFELPAMIELLQPKYPYIVLPETTKPQAGPLRVHICMAGDELTRIKPLQKLADGWACHPVFSFEMKDSTNLMLAHGSHRMAFGHSVKAAFMNASRARPDPIQLQAFGSKLALVREQWRAITIMRVDVIHSSLGGRTIETKNSVLISYSLPGNTPLEIVPRQLRMQTKFTEDEDGFMMPAKNGHTDVACPVYPMGNVWCTTCQTLLHAADSCALHAASKARDRDMRREAEARMEL